LLTNPTGAKISARGPALASSYSAQFRWVFPA